MSAKLRQLAVDMIADGHPIADVLAMVNKHEEHAAADRSQRSHDRNVLTHVHNRSVFRRLLTKDNHALGPGPEPPLYNPEMMDVLLQAALVAYDKGASGEYFTCLMTRFRTPESFRQGPLGHTEYSFLDRMQRITSRTAVQTGEWFIASAGDMDQAELGDAYRLEFGDDAEDEGTIFRISWRALLAAQGRHLAADSILVCTTSCPLLRSTSDGFSETDSASYRRSVAWLVVAFQVYVRGWVEIGGEWHYVCCTVICFALLVQEWVAHPMIGECQMGMAAPVSASLTVGCGLSGTARTGEQPTSQEIHPCFYGGAAAGGAGGGVTDGMPGRAGSKRARTGEGGGEGMGGNGGEVAQGMDVVTE
jgi:hypothetical protein